MYRILHILILILCPFVTFSQDLKFELLAKWESLTPEFPVGFGSDYLAIDIFNIGDFNNDGVPDVGFRTASYSSSNPYDSLYILTLNKNGSVNNCKIIK